MRAAPILAALALLPGCGSLQATAPTGLTCDNVVSVGADLSAALAKARAGDCLVLPEGTWVGTFQVPDDVSVVGSEGATVVLRGDSAGPVLSVRGGPRTTVRKLRIEAPLGSGILIDPGPVNLVSVSVTGAKGNALVGRCTQSDCAQRGSTLEDTELLGSALGLVLRGATLTMKGGRIAGHRGLTLADGTGVVATAGAALTLTGVTIEQNANLGVLLDGATTRASLTGVTVQDNLGRGLWSQGLRGPQTLKVSGGAFVGNARMGLGARDSEGLVIDGARVEGTRETVVQIDIQREEKVGDGVALFAGTARGTFTGLQLRNNFRAQALVDRGGEGLDLAGTLEGGQYKAVIQNTVPSVAVPAAVVDTPAAALFVEPAALALPE